MGFELKPGDICVVQRNFLVEGKLAFNLGDEVKIISISPDPQSPGFKYMAFSEKLGCEVRLRGVDIERKFCPKCSELLDPTDFHCDNCGWVIPGKEDIARQEEFAEFKKRMRERRRDADHLNYPFGW